MKGVEGLGDAVAVLEYGFRFVDDLSKGANVASALDANVASFVAFEGTKQAGAGLGAADGAGIGAVLGAVSGPGDAVTFTGGALVGANVGGVAGGIADPRRSGARGCRGVGEGADPPDDLDHHVGHRRQAAIFNLSKPTNDCHSAADHLPSACHSVDFRLPKPADRLPFTCETPAIPCQGIEGRNIIKSNSYTESATRRRSS